MNNTTGESSSAEDSGDDKKTDLRPTLAKISSITSHPINRMLKLDISTPVKVDTSSNGPSLSSSSVQNALLTSSIPSPSPSSSSQSSMMSPPLPASSSSTPTAPVPQSAVDPVHDLPPEMLQQGWRKFWSKREGRYYFFNKITNESLWDPPHLVHQHQLQRRLSSDPLGINSPVTPTNPSEPGSFPWPSRPSFGEKRSLSMSEGTQEHLLKRPFLVLPGPWSLETPNNSVIYERLPSLMHHPHPEVELMRGVLMAKLRQSYVEMCKSRENIEAPKESFNRWLMERKLIDKGYDPLFPSNCSPEVSKSMYQEIMNDIPVKLFRPKYSGEARKQLSRYAEAANEMIKSRMNNAPEPRKIVKWNVEDTFQWIRKTLNASFDDYQERLRHLRQQCQPHLTEAAKSSVEGICQKIYSLSTEDAKRIREKIQEILKEQNIKETTHPPRMNAPKKVYCYPIDLIQICPKLPAVQFCQDNKNNLTIFRYKNDSIPIKTLYLQKLEHLYRSSCTDDKKFECFVPRVYCLLKRYQSFMGTSYQGEGHSAQVALPLPTFDCLRKDFEVTFECFASPLNCFFRQFCSAFGDTDSYFGSRGSFLQFHPVSGSFVAHPPVQEDLMLAAVNHMERLLNNSSDPLSFIVFLPDWKDPVSQAVTVIESSRFKRESFTLQAFQHDLKNGFQHVCDPKDISIKSSHPTLGVILQNDAGFIKWGPTPDRVEALIDSFKPGKEAIMTSKQPIDGSKESTLLSPPPTPQNNQPVVGTAGTSSTSSTATGATVLPNNIMNSQHNNHTEDVSDDSGHAEESDSASTSSLSQD